MKNVQLWTKGKETQRTRLFLFQIKIQTTNYIISRDNLRKKDLALPFLLSNGNRNRIPSRYFILKPTNRYFIPILETARAMKS